MAEQNQSEDGLGEKPLAELLQTLKATPQGLTSVGAKRRFREHGSNSLVRGSQVATLRSLLRLFVDPLIGILLVASGISVLLGDAVSGSIIIAMVSAQLAAEPLHGPPGAARRGADPEAGGLHRCGCARWQSSAAVDIGNLRRR